MKKIIIFLMLIVCFVSLTSAALTDGLTHYWNYDQTGLNATDVGGEAVGNPLNMTLTGDAEMKTGFIGNGLFCDGTDDGAITFGGTTGLPSGTGDWTLSMWVKSNESATGEFYSSTDGGGTERIINVAGGNVRFFFGGGDTGNVNVPIVQDGTTWNNILLLRQGGRLLMYSNGSLAQNSTPATSSIPIASARVCEDFSGGGDLNGMIDEFGMWNRSLTEEEISEIYNNGLGNAYPFLGISSTLNFPTDGDETTETEIVFNATSTPVSLNITNATINIWYSNGSLFNETTNTLTGNVPNTTTWNISSIPAGTFDWNVYSCAENNSGSTTCNFAFANFSFTVKQFTVEQESFTRNVFETSSQAFRINISTISSILSVSAALNYNGSVHTADSVSCNASGFCEILKEIDIPLVTVGSEQNKSFQWNITVFDGTDSISDLSDEQQQNVSTIFMGECNTTVTTQSVNFTSFDEQSNARIDPFYIAGEFTFWLGNGTTSKPLSFSNTSATELGLCVSLPSTPFFIQDTIEYNEVINSSDYNTRNYFFDQDIFNSTLRHIPLFLLDVDDSTSFILKVQDTNLLPISEALIHIQRLDVGTGNFSTVQIARTDDNGQTVGFFKTETVDYRFIIIKDGVTLLTTTQGKVVPETAPFTLTFTVGADEGAPWVRFEDLPNLTSTLTFNETSGNVTFTYVDTSGEFTLGRLLLIENNLSGIPITRCDVNSTLSSVSIVCGTGNVEGSYVASGFIHRGDEIFLVEQIFFQVQSFSDVVGLYGVFLAWFIILIAAFAFKFNEIAGIVLVNIAVIMVNIIGLVDFGYLFIFGLMGVSIIIIVLLKK